MRETRQRRFLTVTPDSSRVSPLVKATSVRTLWSHELKVRCVRVNAGNLFPSDSKKRLNEIFPCQFLLEAKNSSLLLRAVSKGLNTLLTARVACIVLHVLFFVFLVCLCDSANRPGTWTTPFSGIPRDREAHFYQCNAKTKKQPQILIKPSRIRRGFIVARRLIKSGAREDDQSLT